MTDAHIPDVDGADVGRRAAWHHRCTCGIEEGWLLTVQHDPGCPFQKSLTAYVAAVVAAEREGSITAREGEFVRLDTAERYRARAEAAERKVEEIEDQSIRQTELQEATEARAEAAERQVAALTHKHGEDGCYWTGVRVNTGEGDGHWVCPFADDLRAALDAPGEGVQ